MLSRFRYLFVIIMFLQAVCLWAMPVSEKSDTVAIDDNLRISLVTCYPGDKIYELFGHTAIRVQRSGSGAFDLAFNYGMFSFATGNFVYKFTAGQTDYMLGAYDFDDFMVDYVMRGSKVVEQELNLTPESKQQLLNALIQNARPENRVYRYNFLFDNCATRPRDMVEQAVKSFGVVQYGEEHELPSFRTLIHRYADNYSWFMFGVDLALGHELDRPASWREQMFIPVLLEEAFREAKVVEIIDSIQTEVPLVCAEQVLFDPGSSPVLPPTPWYLTPLFVGLVLLLIALGVTYVDRQYRRVSLWFDSVFYGLCFLGSIVIYFLIFFSEHPTTDINYNALWLTPLSLIAATLPYVRSMRGVVRAYHVLNLVAILLFLITAVFGIQHYNIGVYPLIATSALRSVNYIVLYRISTRTYKPSSLHRNE